MAFINIGFGNMINADKILTMVTPDSAPSKRLVQRAKEHDLCIDATQGRRTKTVIVTTEEKIVLSSLTPETIAGRVKTKE